MTEHALHALSDADNVAVALRDIAAGESVRAPSGETLTVAADVPA